MRKSSRSVNGRLVRHDSLADTPIMSTPAPEPTVVVAAPEEAASATAAAASAASRMAAAFQRVKLTDTEKSDSFAVETLDSNDVLEAEIEVVRAKAATGDVAAVTRKEALETKLGTLVSAVQSDELDLPAYCKILKERIMRDKVLALHLKGEKQDKEAADVVKRIRAMEEELAGVPEDQQGAEEEEQDGIQGTEGSV